MTALPDARDDAGNLDTGAGVIATVLAAARAVATARGLMNDPFAAQLVHRVGLELCSQVADGRMELARLGSDGGFPRLAELVTARTAFFDAFCADAVRGGIRQAVILGAGLDTRAYRLWWPAGMDVYEVDQPRVIEFKTTTMRSWGAAPSASRRAVGIDLRDDWPAALQRVGFDAAAPTAWVIEGLLVWFVPSDAQNRLLDAITELSAPGSRLAAAYTVPPNRLQLVHYESLLERWRRRGLSLTGAGPFYSGEHTDVVRNLAESGWVTVESGIAELFSAARLPPLSDRELDGAPCSIRYVAASRV